MSDNDTPTRFSLSVSLPENSRISEEQLAERERIVEAYYAMSVGNIEALTNMLDPEIEFHQAPGLPYGGSAKGLEETHKLIAAMFGTWSVLHVDVMDVLVGSDTIIAYLMLDGTTRATGQKYTGPTSEMMRLRDGKIVEWRLMYWDTHGVRKACGLA